ncbi:NUDIX hydrolase [Rhizobium etli]|uniref:NUDIX hydrolase n=1 Tax=Rhizobium etli TaxID=29449 RepID=UPI000383928A|nr:NUDIX domain-containing protein [Rhizobium etli]AGS25228.1 NUDIX hydrolase domain-containing protein [Rhizobium etli bv. mimosae str. Mim1]
MKEELSIPNVYGLVFRKGSNKTQILLQERWKPQSDKQNSGKIELPGGKLRAFEAITDCLIREVQEEAGIEVTRILDKTSKFYTGSKDTVLTVHPTIVSQYVVGPYPSLLLVISCEGEGTPKCLGDGSRNAKWWKVTEALATAFDNPDLITPLTLGVIRSQLAT